MKTTGIKPKLMRPAYGELTKRQRILVNHDFGYKVILWDVDPLDWKRPGSNVVAQRIIAGARPGSIILSHDIHPPTIAAMPQVFDALLAKGFKFVTSPSCSPWIKAARGRKWSRHLIRRSSKNGLRKSKR